MKKIVYAACLLMLISRLGYAQTDKKNDNVTGDGMQAGWGALNYAVPESPAFKILGTSPSNILRPTSTRDIAISVGNYLASGSQSIPQNLAVEISPALFNPAVNLHNFSKKRWWYTSAFSVGTKVNSDKSYAIGIGLKFKLIDQADLRLDKKFLAELDKYGKMINTGYSKALTQVTDEYHKRDTSKPYIQWDSDISDAYSDTTGKNPLHNAVKKEIDDLIAKSFDVNRISNFRDSIKKELWNKQVWDIGVATLLNSKDSLISNIRAFTKFGLWSTFANPIGKKGQILIGITAEMRDTIPGHSKIKTLNIGTRAYYGNNDTKGFVEANMMMQENNKGTYKASLGIERSFGGGIWLDFNLGISKQGGNKTAFTSGFNILFGNGEKKSVSGS